MRVLHVIPAVATRYGGPSAAVVGMCRALQSAGVDTLILATDADGERRLDVETGRPTDWDGVPAIFFPRDFSESFKYSRRLAQWVRRHAAEFDVVHIHAVFSHACLAAASACRHAGTPYIVRPLGTIARWSLGQRALRKRALLALGAARMLRDAAAIHYTSAGEQHDAESGLGLARGFVSPLGIDAALLDAQPLRRSASPYVLVLSRLHEKKNLEPLVDAFVESTAGSQNAGWRLVLAGDGNRDYVERLRQRVAIHAAHDRVEFAGWVGGDRKRELLRQAALFALPSLQENFAISLFEAMASGVPAILSRHVDVAGDIERASAGWIVEPDRVSLKAALAEAMVSGAERGRRGDAARAFATRFSWPTIARHLADVYRGLVTSAAQTTSPQLASVGR